MASSQELLLGTGTAVNQYQIQRSLRFNSADSAYLNRTPASAGNRRTWTWSGWFKLGKIDNWGGLFNAGTSGDQFAIYLFTDSTLYIQDFVSPANNIQIQTTQVFRDPSAWYHLVVAIDTTQATSTNRVKVYINGTQVTAFSTSTYPSQNYDTQVNSTSFAHNVGRNFQFATSTAKYFDGYLTEVNFIDGQALTPSSFGETNADTGVWQPKAYSGTFGTNGFQLLFADNSGTTSTTLGKDTSGNGNNWTPNNFSVTAGAGNDSLVDTPTPYGTDTGAGGEVRGNYCTANPLDIYPKSGTWTVANGNLDLSLSGAVWDAIRGTTGVTSGKWYWEITATAIDNSNSYAMVGIQKGAAGNFQDPLAYVYYSLNGQKYNNGSGAAYGNSWTTNDVVGVAFDADAGEIKFYKNNTVQNSGTAAFTGLTSGPYTPVIMLNGTGSTATVTCNFGQRPFAYTAPSGFKALCTQNLPTPTIGATATTRADDYSNVALYTGTGTSQNINNNLDMATNGGLVWAKSRDVTGSHVLTDSVRGVNKALFSNLTATEDTNNRVTAFISTGFTLNNESNDPNQNGITYASWSWLGGGTGSSNTAGSISSTVSANTTAGFSIVSYTGTGANATVGHGLGVAPSMIIVKCRNAATSWRVYHTSIGNTGAVYLNTTVGTETNSVFWNNTSPTSSVFTVGTDPGVNGSSNTFVAYCFAPVAGYSAFGSFTGNGSTDGAFVYTGFRPAWVMMKVTNEIGAGGNWGMFDNDRLGYNSAQRDLRANLTNAEGTDNDLIDFLSNGFKIRTTSAGFGGGSGNTYIYAAFAENPFKYSLAR